MQDAEELFYESTKLMIRAEKAPTPTRRNALFANMYRMTKRVLRVDPSVINAQFNLGLMYQKGRGVQQDSKQAAAWYQKAAEQGSTRASVQAQFNLGIMYQKGQGVQQDFKQAAAWYRKAADQGIVQAQHNLGVMYAKGEGVQQDLKQAAAWIQKEADQGQTKAHLNLGDLSEMAGDYQAAFESYRAGQVADREQARAGMRRCLEKMADSRKKDACQPLHLSGRALAVLVAVLAVVLAVLAAQ
jgi:TPR repeat protein